MTVYIDNVRNRLGPMIMCHMIADSIDELHVMAARLNLKRAWFQHDTSNPHYDISLSKRKRSIELGAVVCDRRTFVGHLQRIREARHASRVRK